jgi:uncharacterized membrane protein YecN with MAPEG domain
MESVSPSKAVATAATAATASASAALVGGGGKTLNWYFLIPLTILLFNIANMVFGGLVVQARTKYGIPYPTMYAVPGRTRYYDESMRPTDGSDKKLEERITNEEAFRFNSIQRGHQNTVENAPFFLALLVVAADTYPMIAGIAGLLYIIGRALYMYGYSQDPKLRFYGAFFIYPPLLTLFVLTGMRISEIYQS